MPVTGTPISTPGSGPNGFTTETKILRLYSELGVDNMFSDIVDDDERTNIINQIIADAEETIILRLNQYHTVEDLAANGWIQSRATWIAAYYLSQRKGQEHYFQSKFDEALRELDAIGTGELPIRFDIPLRAMISPSMSNMRVTDGFTVQKLRVVEQISVGGTYANKHSDFDLWGWL